MGLKVDFMIRNLIIKIHILINFLMEGLEKFPNAGLLALCYTLDVIKPKNLWICGLDFYSKDYILEDRIKLH